IGACRQCRPGGCSFPSPSPTRVHLGTVLRLSWTALTPLPPSLARQRTLEDEEEQEREQRRRRRNLSSATDDEAPGLSQSGAGPAAERLPSVEEAEGSKLPPQACKDEDEDFLGILRTRQERRQRRQKVEAAQVPVWEQQEAGPGRDSAGPGQAKEQPLMPKKEVELPPLRRLSREQRGPWAGEEESAVGSKLAGGKKGVLEKKSSGPEKTLALEKRLISGETSTPEETAGPAQTSVLEKTAVSEKKSILEKMSVLEKLPGKASGLEGRLAPEEALIFEKPLVSKRTAASGSPAQEQPASGAGQSPSKEQRGRALPEKIPPSLAGQGAPGPPTVASRLPPITLQPPSDHTVTEAGVGCWQLRGISCVLGSTWQPVALPRPEPGRQDTSQCLGSLESFHKFPWEALPSGRALRDCVPMPAAKAAGQEVAEGGRRTAPPPAMSPRKENSETTLTRSASVRLPASTARLGEKLERYHTAVQRSESVKSPGSSRTEFFVAPVGVASKRHLFEKEAAGRSQVEPASSRKENLRLSGVVTSRLNLWISRTQESGAQDPQASDCGPFWWGDLGQ
ncbi:hypothetical protein MC885_013435, partial [Smutsia gigantea]